MKDESIDSPRNQKGVWLNSKCWTSSTAPESNRLKRYFLNYSYFIFLSVTQCPVFLLTSSCICYVSYVLQLQHFSISLGASVFSSFCSVYSLTSSLYGLFRTFCVPWTIWLYSAYSVVPLCLHSSHSSLLMNLITLISVVIPFSLLWLIYSSSAVYNKWVLFVDYKKGKIQSKENITKILLKPLQNTIKKNISMNIWNKNFIHQFTATMS